MTKYILIFFLAVSGLVNAQDVFVYYLKGASTLQAAGKTVALKENAVFAKGSKITLKKGASVVLFKAEKFVVLKEPKIYTYEIVAQLFAKSKPSHSGKYVAMLGKRAKQNPTNSNVNKMAKMPADGGEGIQFPFDSTIAITDALVLSVDEESVPGSLYIFDGSEVIYSLAITQTKVKMYNMGILKEGSWYGMAVTSEDNLPYASILRIKWATQAEKEAIKNEQGRFLAEIKPLPLEVQSQLIQLYEHDKRYVALEE